MTLGQRIYQYRSQKNLSQLELAERLDVSRQSISKWETDASVPELEKLVKMCEVFDVTLDQLVRGIEPKGPEPEPDREVAAVVVHKTPVRAILGGVLLACGVLITVFLFLMGAGAWALLYGAPFLGSGLVCLLVKKHTLLWAGWVVWLPVYGYLRYATMIRWWWAFMPWIYRQEMWTHAMIAWGETLTLFVLTAATARMLWNWRKHK